MQCYFCDKEIDKNTPDTMIELYMPLKPECRGVPNNVILAYCCSWCLKDAKERNETMGQRDARIFGNDLVVPKEGLSEAQKQIEECCDSHKKMLLEKNRRYGNSVLGLEPVFMKHFCKDDIQLNGLLVRLDDKISRIRNSDVLRKNDVSDLIGYAKLLCVKMGWTDFDDLID